MKKVLVLFLLLFASCTLHSPYFRPKQEIPSHWRIPTATEESDDKEEISWWSQFNDPVLEELIACALRNNQEIQVAIHRVDAFFAKLQITESDLYPQFSGQISAEREKSSAEFPVAIDQNLVNNIFNLVLNASYFLDFWGKVKSATEASLAEFCSQIQNRRSVVLSIVSAVALSYIRLRQLDQQLFIAKETLITRNESAYLAQIRYELGLTSKLQVDQAQAEVEDAQAKVKQFEIAIALQEDSLSLLLGESSREIPRGKLLENLTLPPKVPAFLPSALLNQRPDILAAEQKLIAANARIGVAKAEFFPQINLTGAYGTESLALKDLFRKSSSFWQYGMSLLQEIFTGGRLTGQLKFAKAEKQQLLHEYQSTILNGFKEVNDALIAHQISLELFEVQTERVYTLKDYLRLSTLRYEEGETDYLTVLDAQRQLFAAELEYTQTQGNCFGTFVQIYQSLGGGWVKNADDVATSTEEDPSCRGKG